MSIVSENSDGICRITLPAKFGFNDITEFRDAYQEADSAEYVIDFRMTEYMDSSGLGMLMNLKRHVGGGNITLIDCQPQIKKVLMISRFDKMFKIV